VQALHGNEEDLDVARRGRCDIALASHEVLDPGGRRRDCHRGASAATAAAIGSLPRADGHFRCVVAPGIRHRSRVEIVPRSIVPPADRVQVERIWAADVIEGRPGGYVFFVDQGTFPEKGMSWVRGGASGTMLVAPGGAGELRVKLRNGASGGRLTVSALGHLEERHVAPWESTDSLGPRAPRAGRGS